MSSCATTVIYCRISSQSQAQGVSLDAQISFCKNYLNGLSGVRNGPMESFTIVQEIASVYSEKTPPLLNVLVQKKNHCVVFYSVDRFSRNSKAGRTNALTMLKNKTTLIFSQENLVLSPKDSPKDSQTSREWNLFVDLLDKAHAESRAISNRVKNSFQYLRENGFHTSGSVPYGFEAVPDAKQPQRKRLQECKVETEILNFIQLCRKKNANVDEINKSISMCSPLADVNPIVIEKNSRVCRTLEHPIEYRDIAWFLNEYGLSYRGKEWTIYSVSSVYNRAIKGSKGTRGDIDGDEAAESDDDEEMNVPPPKKILKPLRSPLRKPLHATLRTPLNRTRVFRPRFVKKH